MFLRDPVLEFTAAGRTVFPMSALRLFAILRFRRLPSGPLCNQQCSGVFLQLRVNLRRARLQALLSI